MLDVKFRNKGGLNIGEAPLAVTDPKQIGAEVGTVMNVGEIDPSRPIIEQSGHPDYPQGVPGQGLGRLPEGGRPLVTDILRGDTTRYEGDVGGFVTDDWVGQKGLAPDEFTNRVRRSLEMKPYGSIITDKTLKGLQQQGYEVGNADPRLLAAIAAAMAAGLSAQDAEAAVVKAYKLFKTKKSAPGELFPLFVDANTPVPQGEWVKATAGELTDKGQVKSKIGPLAYRPGWHAGDKPVATHIGGKSSSDLKAPDYRPDDQVWAEIEMLDDVDWQSVANENASRNKAGQIIPRTAHITDQVPYGGHYRYKTNPNMTGEWLIGGDMKVNRILDDAEVQALNAGGPQDLPRQAGQADPRLLPGLAGVAGLGAAALAPEEAEASIASAT